MSVLQEVVLEGFCLNKDSHSTDTAADGEAPSRSKRGAMARFIAGATGKMNIERSKPSKMKSKKRRKSVAVDTPGASNANCYDAFHRKDDTKSYHKTRKLQLELDRLFALRPKVSPEQARAIMKSAIDPEDGGLMFCYAKRGQFMAKSDPRYATWSGCTVCNVEKGCNCNGMLLSLEQITNAWSSRASKEKKDRQKKGIEELDYSAARGRVDG